LASSKTDMFAVALGTLMDNITSVFNQFGIRRLQALNGRPKELDPKLVHGDIEPMALNEIAPFIQAMASSGLLTANPALERKLLEIADLPQPPEEEGLEEPPEIVPPPTPPEAAPPVPVVPNPDDDDDDDDEDD